MFEVSVPRRFVKNVDSVVNYTLAPNSPIWQVSDPASIAETFTLVDWLYAQRVPASGLSEAEVVADITGATKPMTAGMVLACGSRRPMQYLLFQQDGPSLPIALQVQTPPVYPPQAIPYP